MKLNNFGVETIKKVQEITKTDYEIKDNYIEDYTAIDLINDLLYEIDYLKDHIDFYNSKQVVDYSDYEYEVWKENRND